ncbi:periplasmic chaperone for outer membrane proteins SurA [Desulfocicer vacuolatum DSM 3385]|uniref:Periplasmic chaperone for outer membrane proteins SurA n=1 Tax=Desulfocicer vacuolatum DSM 3385 TaxID=1121400 RepID=A0A1W2BH79_9BACT|nr:SurA N-terminal domain-containing protein [Desulfocicer vacuolatum]SMC71788.1 periplasmic chaperone for outer membrane proteins SurA [Desulfocicer vacuolatum DSM 3385]
MIKRYLLVYYCLFFICMTSSMVSAEIVDRVAAVVNDDIITLSDLNKAIKPYEEKLASSGYSREQMNAMRYNMRQEMLNNLVDRKITDQEAKKLGITVSEKEVDNAVAQLKKSRMMTQEDLEKALQQEGLTFKAYRKKIREEILRPKLINFSVKSKVIITDEDIKAYYDAHPEIYAGTQKIYLRNILISQGALAVDALVQEKFNEVNTALLSGRTFGQVARQYSQAPNAQDGGEIGFLSLDALSKEIADAVRGLSAGEHTEFIQTDLGYQMFFVEKVEDGNPRSIESVSDEISKKLYNDIVEKKFKTWLKELREKSYVKNML